MKRILGAFVALFSILVGGMIAAPTASAVSKGCGELSNGILCNSGPVPNEGTYTTSYVRHGARGEITVRLGFEIKIERTGQLAQTTWIGYKKTKNGYAELSKWVMLSDEGCIRGIMEYNDTKYVTKWRC
ncbi:hypothetical protein [Streptomyces sp. NPDC101115]|uniref:hypothetical protein n=1 Tax=Streptomyces sp. NPDC101115 TaxID=3366106 RepID=UPI00382BCA69